MLQTKTSISGVTKNTKFTPSDSEYQKLGYDLGSTVSDVLDTPTIIQAGKDLLGIKDS